MGAKAGLRVGNQSLNQVALEPCLPLKEAVRGGKSGLQAQMTRSTLERGALFTLLVSIFPLTCSKPSLRWWVRVLLPWLLQKPV